jgi:hypothetical protein
MARHTVKPGQRVESSGIYRDTKSGERSTLVHGKTAPPTPERGGKWREVDETRVQTQFNQK